jgi:hypothetical protein
LSELAGLRVQVTILEDGTPHSPKLPKGTIVRTITGPQNVAYQLGHLDHQVSCTHARTNDSWTLADLLIAPSFQGDSTDTTEVEKRGDSNRHSKSSIPTWG